MSPLAYNGQINGSREKLKSGLRMDCKLCIAACAGKRVLLYTYCDILFGKCEDKSRVLQVKFDPDWSDDFSYK